MPDHRKAIADAITAMTFGELTEMAADMRDAIGSSWKTWSGEEYSPLDLASALHSWAEGQKEGPHD